MSDEKKEPWHLDRRVPVALILAIFLQTAGAFWWASNIDSRVAQLENQMESRAMVNERLARMEERVEGLRADISDIRGSMTNIERYLRQMARQADK